MAVKLLYDTVIYIISQKNIFFSLRKLFFWSFSKSSILFQKMRLSNKLANRSNYCKSYRVLMFFRKDLKKEIFNFSQKLLALTYHAPKN